MPHQKKERAASIQSNDLINLQNHVKYPTKQQYQSIKIAKPKYIQKQEQQHLQQHKQSQQNHDQQINSDEYFFKEQEKHQRAQQQSPLQNPAGQSNQSRYKKIIMGKSLLFKND